MTQSIRVNHNQTLANLHYDDEIWVAQNRLVCCFSNIRDAFHCRKEASGVYLCEELSIRCRDFGSAKRGIWYYTDGFKGGKGGRGVF